MPLIDVPIFTDPAALATYLAAIRQADAAIEAAKIAADATWDTALWIGAPTAFAALFAAGFTYLSAIRAAKEQTKLETEKHEARVTAYAIRQIHQIDRAIGAAIRGRKQNTEAFNIITLEGAQSKKLRGLGQLVSPDKIPDDWGDNKWEDHALLGQKYVKQLMYIGAINRVHLARCEIIREHMFAEPSSIQEIQELKNLLSTNDKGLKKYENMLIALKEIIPKKYRDIEPL